MNKTLSNAEDVRQARSAAEDTVVRVELALVSIAMSVLVKRGSSFVYLGSQARTVEAVARMLAV